MHIDTDEANAATIMGFTKGEIYERYSINSNNRNN